MKIYPSHLFWEFDHFSSSIEILYLFWVKFCIWCEVGVPLHCIVCGYLVVPVLFAENSIVSPLNILGALVKKQWAIDVQSLNSIPLVYMSIVMPVSHFFDHITVAL